MDIRINPKTFFVFDLDDTLYQEIDFLKSAYRFISKELEGQIQLSLYDEMLTRYKRKENVFGWILETYGQRLDGWDKNRLIESYRNHLPEISLSESTRTFLEAVKSKNIPSGLITDGRSRTQRNKLAALGILDMFREIVISEEFGSEKPDERNYLHFSHTYPGCDFYYFGDNVTKDFITPQKLGWHTICLKDQGHHIHSQQSGLSAAADFVINDFTEIHLI